MGRPMTVTCQPKASWNSSGRAIKTVPLLLPESADSCRLFTTLWRDDLCGDPVRMAEAVAFEVEVLREDLRIQESFHDLVLPLALTAEVHTRADRTTLELRRVLADLVATVEG